MSEVNLRLLLQHSRPDLEVSKPSSDSHPVSNRLRAENGDSLSILASLCFRDSRRQGL